jgi:hypothetical protein
MYRNVDLNTVSLKANDCTARDRRVYVSQPQTPKSQQWSPLTMYLKLGSQPQEARKRHDTKYDLMQC